MNTFRRCLAGIASTLTLAAAMMAASGSAPAATAPSLSVQLAQSSDVGAGYWHTSPYPDASSSTGYDATWWGGDLQGVAQPAHRASGSRAISPWSLTWTFPGDEQISSMWTASYTQSGEDVTATNESYNATIAPSASVTIGFTGTYTSSDAAPTSFSVNGTACS
jgi:endoglucanase